MVDAKTANVDCSKCMEHMAVIQSQSRCVEDRRDLWKAMNAMRGLGYTLLGGMALALLGIIGNMLVARNIDTPNAHEFADQMVTALQRGGYINKPKAGGGT